MSTFIDFSLCLVKAEDLKRLYDEKRGQIKDFPYLLFQNRGLLDLNQTIKLLIDDQTMT